MRENIFLQLFLRMARENASVSVTPFAASSSVPFFLSLPSQQIYADATGADDGLGRGERWRKEGRTAARRRH